MPHRDELVYLDGTAVPLEAAALALAAAGLGRRLVARFLWSAARPPRAAEMARQKDTYTEEKGPRGGRIWVNARTGKRTRKNPNRAGAGGGGEADTPCARRVGELRVAVAQYEAVPSPAHYAGLRRACQAVSQTLDTAAPAEREAALLEMATAEYRHLGVTHWAGRFPQLAGDGPATGKVLYSGVVLDEPSRTRLLAGLADRVPDGWRVLGHHMTTAFGKGLPPELQGRAGRLRATHWAADHELGVVAVRVESDIPSENATPHITVAVAPHGKPANSNKLTDWQPLPRSIALTGTAQDVRKDAGKDAGKGRLADGGAAAWKDSAAAARLRHDARHYATFEEFADPGLNTPGGRRWPAAAAAANELLARHGGRPQNFEVRLVPLAAVTPSQHGEDYLNDSSRETARGLRGLLGGAKGVRREDLNPIAVRGNGLIIDGNHRHAAHTLNGDGYIAALVPVGDGDGTITNLRQVYDKLKGRQAAG